MSDKLFYCFDDYRLDAQTRVLYRGDNVVRLEPKIVDMLLFMVQRQGMVVSKEELMKNIWAGTIVEESAIRRNISLMRSVLDPVNSDRYVETLPRQGYRFKVPVTQQAVSTSRDTQSIEADVNSEAASVVPNESGNKQSVETTQEVVAVRKSRKRRWVLWLNVALVLILGVVLVYRFVVYPRLYRPIIDSRQLTTNSEDLPIITSALSPDGSMIAFADEATLFVGDSKTIERHPLKLPDNVLPRDVEWFYDSIHLMVSALNPEAHQFLVWRVPVLGGKPELIIRDARMAMPSADGRKMLFIRNDNQLWVANIDGSDAKLLMTPPENYSFGSRPQFSQHGEYVLYSLFTASSTRATIEARHIETGRVTTLYESPQRVMDFRLLGDSELLLSQQVARGSNVSQLISINVHLRTGFHSVSRVLATSSDGVYADINATRDGRLLLALVRRSYSTVQIGTLNATGTEITNVKRLTKNDSHNLPSSWLPDSRSVLFFSNRTGHYGIFQQDIDVADARALVIDERDYIRPVISFDGKWLFYFMPEDASKMADNMRMSMWRQPLNGGVSQMIDTRPDFYRSLRCATQVNKCVMTEHDNQFAAFYEFDPVQGKGKEIIRVGWAPQITAFYWDVSSDGAHIAYLDTTRGSSDIAILNMEASSVSRQDLHINGYDPFATLYWDAHAKGFYVSSYNSNGDLLKLLHVDLAGKVDVVRQQVGSQLSWSIPSPDGQYLMFQKFASKSNIWLMQR